MRLGATNERPSGAADRPVRKQYGAGRVVGFVTPMPWRRPAMLSLSRREAVMGLLGSAAGATGASAFLGEFEDGGLGADAPAAIVIVAAANASRRVLKAADFTCRGKNDHEVINEAVAACGNGGLVLLTPGRFVVSGAIRLRSRVTLMGAGRSTVLRASGAWEASDGSATGAVVELAETASYQTGLRHLSIDGNKGSATCKGIMYNVDAFSSEAPTGPDPVHLIDDVHVTDTDAVGLHLTGGSNRSTTATRVRVLRAGESYPAEGILVESFDGFFAECESGAATGDGFRIDGANNRFSNCKSWYSQLNGFDITGVRTQLSVCEAQDNGKHGFLVAGGPTTLSGCHADSNSRPEASGTDVSDTRGKYDGFNLPFAESVQLVGCQAYDRREGGGSTQRYGFYLGEDCRDCVIVGIARHNVLGAVGGAGTASPGTLLTVTGDAGVRGS